MARFQHHPLHSKTIPSKIKEGVMQGKTIVGVPQNFRTTLETTISYDSTGEYKAHFPSGIKLGRHALSREKIQEGRRFDVVAHRIRDRMTHLEIDGWHSERVRRSFDYGRPYQSGFLSFVFMYIHNIPIPEGTVFLLWAPEADCYNMQRSGNSFVRHIISLEMTTVDGERILRIQEIERNQTFSNQFSLLTVTEQVSS